MAARYEVEQKYPVADVEAIEARLRDIGGQIGSPQTQADLYFAHPSRNFVQTDEALRIRQVGRSNCITYKGPKIDTTTKTRREIEVSLADGEDTAEQLAELLQVLGFRRVAEVRKSRRAVKIPGQDETVTGALDDVQGLGTFIELELISEEDGLNRARQTLSDLAVRLHLKHSERRGYLDLLLEKADPRDG